MADSAFLVNEDQYEWELDPWDEGRASRIRQRTCVSAGRTPSSGISMGVFELPPGAGLDPHHHRPPEVYYVTGGAAEVLVGGRWRPLGKGDVAYFPGDVVHGARNRGAETCTIVWVFATDSYDKIEYFAD